MDPEQTNNESNNIPPTERTAAPLAINQPITSNPPEKYKVLKKILILISILTITITFLVHLLLAIGLFGGIDNLISNLKPAPNPKSRSVTKKRNSAKKHIDTEFSQLEKSFTPSQTTDSTYDNCYEGQNNWKVKDGYAHRCHYRVTRYYGFSDDFRQKMLNLEEELFNLNWESSNEGMQLSYYIKNYYDKYSGGTNPQVSANFGDNYLVSSMPRVINGYIKNNVEMDIAYAERDDKSIHRLESALNLRNLGLTFYEDSNFIDVRSAFTKITKNNKYVIAISLQKNYFQN